MQPSSVTTPTNSLDVMVRCRCWVGSLILGWGAVAAAAGPPAAGPEEDVGSWLERMTRAIRTLDYEGTFVYLHDNQLESIRIIHSVEEGRERKRLISLNGAAREVVLDNDSLACILPEARAVSIFERRGMGGFPVTLPANLQELSDYYDFRILGNARVAARFSRVIAVIPRDFNRYGYRLYLDADHALPLKTDMINESGGAVAQIMFTSLQTGLPADRKIEAFPASTEKGYALVHQAPKREVLESDVSNWHFRYMPAGFRLRAHSRHPRLSGNGEVEHFVISDGLATLSVYMEKSGDGAGLQGEARMGALNAYGAEVAGHQVTAVGEVPAQTVHDIVNAAEYRPAKKTP